MLSFFPTTNISFSFPNSFSFPKILASLFQTTNSNFFFFQLPITAFVFLTTNDSFSFHLPKSPSQFLYVRILMIKFKVNGYNLFCAITKGDNFYDFLVASMGNKTFPIVSYFYTKYIVPTQWAFGAKMTSY